MNKFQVGYLLGLAFGAYIGVAIIAPAVENRNQTRRAELRHAVSATFEQERQMEAFRAAQEAARAVAEAPVQEA